MKSIFTDETLATTTDVNGHSECDGSCGCIVPCPSCKGRHGGENSGTPVSEPGFYEDLQHARHHSRQLARQ